MMNQTFTDIFETSTALSRDELSFSESNVKAVSDWVSSLSIMQLGDTSRALFSALIELSELNCSETLRFDLLQTMHPVLENVLASFEKHFFNQGLINTARNEHIIELAILLRKHFAGIYIDIVRRSTEQLEQNKFSVFALHKKKNLQTARTLAIFYGLRQLTELLYQEHMLYSEPMAGQWLIAHYLYKIAMKAHVHLTNINQVQGTQNQLSNITQAYAQLILLDILNTNQIRQAEIQALYQCSFDWAKKIQIYPKETTLSKYVIDTEKDHPPVYNKHQNSGFTPSIYIVIQDLLEHITATLHRNADYLSQTEKIYLSPALKFHVQNILGTIAERQHERYEYSAQLHICFGLLTAHFYLSKAKNFNETLQLDSHYGFQNSSRMASGLTQQESSASVPNNQRLNREAKLIYQTEVLDISVNGYRIKWTEEAPKNLRTGEFILVKENTHSQWRGGVIRWIKQSAEKSLEIGLEILAQDIFPCAVRVQADRHSNNYYPALLMQSQNLDQVKTTLILPGSQIFREQQGIHLRLEKQEFKVYLLKAQLITQSFVQFDYELLDDQQQNSLKDFMFKQAKDSDNQDLWEALK
ncbi:GTPase [Acinetobacter guerrae]|uniref:GTPase n=1 Tax=Acinetobacter guerrae TaxID=1843371 RepID=A0A3A8ENF6_9GAMM|nr:GTPase [Acinetobacter guerrae]RKG35698.1 GTPase [Acinetobacter guerrae]